MENGMGTSDTFRGWDAAELSLLQPSSERPGNTGHTVVVLGPPGVGKTSTVKALSGSLASHDPQTYLERPDLNPFLYGNDAPKDLARSQEWFLAEYERFFERRDGGLMLVDQDPRAVVLAYTNLLAHRGKIDKAVYKRQISRCSKIWWQVAGRNSRVDFISLSAEAKTLAKRIAERDAFATFETSVVSELLPRFHEFEMKLRAYHPQNVLALSTEKLTPSEIVTAILGHLRIQSQEPG